MTNTHPSGDRDRDRDGQTTNIHVRAELARRCAVEAAVEAHRAIVQHLIAKMPGDEYEDRETTPRYLMTHDPAHPGDPANDIDVKAHNAAVASLVAGMARDLNVPSGNLIIAGEDVPAFTGHIKQNDFIGRFDAVDGTTNSLLYWNGYSCVILIDQVRILSDGRSRARHWGGAIVGPQGRLSWTNDSSYHQDLGRYPQIRGKVFFEHPEFVPEREINNRRWNRMQGTIAAVAHSDERYTQVRRIASSHALTIDRFLSSGGTPLAPALIGGDVAVIIEPHNVSLHDSSLLIPHQILGGEITDLDGKPLDYLHCYEHAGLNLDPNYKPIHGYIAWGGLR